MVLGREAGWRYALLKKWSVMDALNGTAAEVWEESEVEKDEE